MNNENMFILDEGDAAKRRSALGTILADMDVPEMRRDLSLVNLRWLIRNMRANNADHPLIDSAMALVKWLVRWESRQ